MAGFEAVLRGRTVRYHRRGQLYLQGASSWSGVFESFPCKNGSPSGDVKKGSDAEWWKHPFVPVSTLILSGHDGDDAKPYQERAVRDLLRKIAEARRSAEL
jgi:hypothetical protein